MKSPKLQRWLDLLAALLRRHYPVTFEELIPDVPAYAAPGQKSESRRRTFERDKDELRAFGVPIETVPGPDPEVKAYQLRVRDFYLPYLTLRTDRPARPRKIDRYGYQSLPSLAFEPEELGDPLLAEHAESAMRKLACDLPVDAAGRDEPDARLVPPRARASAELMVLLDGALRARKRVTFRYRSMGSGADGAREVEPFGLFYLNQHWYLAARAPGDTAVKNYRLNRIAEAKVSQGRPGTPDYEIPTGFDPPGLGAGRGRRGGRDRPLPEPHRRRRRRAPPGRGGPRPPRPPPLPGPPLRRLRPLAPLLRRRPGPPLPRRAGRRIPRPRA